MSFSTFQKELVALFDEAFLMNGEIVDSDYAFFEEMVEEIEEKDKLSMYTDEKRKNNVLMFKPRN